MVGDHQSKVKHNSDNKKCAITSKIKQVAGVWKVPTLCASSIITKSYQVYAKSYQVYV